MQFELTPAGLGYIQEVLLKSHNQAAVGIRIGIKKAGCSGYEYVLEYVYPQDIEVLDPHLDFVFEYNKVKIVVDKAVYLKYFKGGTIIDYRQEGLNEGLHFENPNVESKCGCGESFNLKADVGAND